MIEKGKAIKKWKFNYYVKSYFKQKTDTTSQKSRYFKTNHYNKADNKEKRHFFI